MFEMIARVVPTRTSIGYSVWFVFSFLIAFFFNPAVSFAISFS